MSVFVWEGKLANGSIKKGEIEATDKAAAALILKRQRIIPTKLKAKAKEYHPLRAEGQDKGDCHFHQAVLYHDQCRIAARPVP